jgi:hypothetical protein
MKDKIKKMSHLKRRAMIKGEMPMIKIRKTTTPKSPPSNTTRSPRELHPQRYS